MRQRCTPLVSDTEAESIEAARGASAFAGLHQDLVPAFVQINRKAIGPVVIELIPEWGAELTEDLLVVQPDSSPIICSQNELRVLIRWRIKVSVRVAHNPVMPIGEQLGIKIDDIAGVGRAAAMRLHPDIPVAEREVWLVAIVGFPTDLLFQSIVLLSGIKLLLRWISLCEAIVILIWKRTNQLPVTNGCLLLR